MHSLQSIQVNYYVSYKYIKVNL